MPDPDPKAHVVDVSQPSPMAVDPNQQLGLGRYLGPAAQLGAVGIMAAVMWMQSRSNMEQLERAQQYDHESRLQDRTDWKAESREARELFWTKIGGKVDALVASNDDVRKAYRDLQDELRRNRLIAGPPRSFSLPTEAKNAEAKPKP